MKITSLFKPLLTASLLSTLTPAVAQMEQEKAMQPTLAEPDFATNPAPEPQKPAPEKALPESKFHESASLGQAIDAYKKNPSDENRASIKFALKRLDLNIAEQQNRLSKTKGADHAKTLARLGELKKYRSAQMERLPSNTAIASNPAHRRHLARVSTSDNRSAAEKAKDAALNAKDKMVSGAETVGSKAKAGAKEAAIKTKEGAETVAEKVESGSKKVGRTVGKGFRKTGEAIERASED